MIDPEERRWFSPGKFLAGLVLCALATSCQTATSLGEIAKLRAAIVKEFIEPAVNVNLHNDRAITVTFINSRLNEKSPEERRKRAEATATFVRRQFASAGKIEEIWISFVRQKSSFIIVTQTESLDYFGFDNYGQPISFYGDNAQRLTEDSLEVTVKYLPTTDETEVLISTLQLQGNMAQGVAVIPHFTVPGDATGLKRSPQLPKTVSFDFACYSPKSLFRGDTQIKFIADQKVVLETSGEFSSTRGQDGTYSEFLLLKVSYLAFQLMTSGQTLTIVMDDQEYELSSEQLQALRKMTKYVRD